MNLQVLRRIVTEAVTDFPANALCVRVDRHDLVMDDYHRILKAIFHQTYEGPSSFALAGANCGTSRPEIRDYLLHHAEEESLHWQWVISDLRSTGYSGADPRDEFPALPTQNYISYLFYLAQRCPVARLGPAAVLESIGATYGKRYATEVCRQLRLAPEQAKFFFGHGDTDVGHTEDIFRVLEAAELTATEWRWLSDAAQKAGVLYRQLYEHAASARDVALA